MKHHEINQLNDHVKVMDRSAKQAIEWIQRNPNSNYTHSVLNVFRTWNREQEQFWADVFNKIRQQETINAIKEEKEIKN